MGSTSPSRSYLSTVIYQTVTVRMLHFWQVMPMLNNAISNLFPHRLICFVMLPYVYLLCSCYKYRYGNVTLFTINWLFLFFQAHPLNTNSWTGVHTYNHNCHICVQCTNVCLGKCALRL